MPCKAQTHRPAASTGRKATDSAYDRRRGKTAERGYDANWRRVAGPTTTPSAWSSRRLLSVSL